MTVVLTLVPSRAMVVQAIVTMELAVTMEQEPAGQTILVAIMQVVACVESVASGIASVLIREAIPNRSCLIQVHR